MAHVWHHDGVSALRHETELTPVAQGFSLATAPETVFAWADLMPGDDRGSGPFYRHKTLPGWRLGFAEPPPPAIAVRLPRAARYGGLIDRFGLAPSVAVFAAASAAVLALVLSAPYYLAPLIPASFETQLGDALVGDMGGRICDGAGGQAALDRLVARIEPAPEGLKVRVINVGTVNAVALPGGNIFLFRGLLQEAKTPDEVAGVVGHEIGHVRNRDVMQALLRQTGLSLVLGGVGGNSGGYLNAMVSATYSRSAETRADGYAIDALRRGRITPVATAGFFARLAAAEAKLGQAAAALGYLASHPMSQSRERAFLASRVAGTDYASALSPTEWEALVDICHNDPDVAKDSGLFF